MESRKEEFNKNTIRCFGYGANASIDMMEAIIGRRPDGLSARLPDYELWIQSWEEIPVPIREILKKHWDTNFKTYAIRPAKGKAVAGRVWFLNSDELRLMNNWEFWYKPITVQVQLEDGGVYQAETGIIDDPTANMVVDGEHHPLFINDKEQMLRIAKSVRNNPPSLISNKDVMRRRR